MKITYMPEEGKQGDTIDKYGEFFSNGETRDIEDSQLAAKMLTCPYFVEEIKISSNVTVLEAPKKKRTRRTKEQMAKDNG